MPVTMINPFRVAPEHETAFLNLWNATAAIFQAQPGFVSADLVRALPQQPHGLRAPYTHINIAVWDTPEDYANALKLRDIRKLSGQYLAIATFAPALYELIETRSPDTNVGNP